MLDNKEFDNKQDVGSQLDESVHTPTLPKKGIDVKKIILMVIILLLALVIGVGADIYKFKSDNNFSKTVASIVPYPMAIVNYQPISMINYWQELSLILRTCQEVGTNCSITDQDKEEVKNMLVDEKVVEILAKNKGITISDEDFNTEYQKIVDQNGGREQFLKVLIDNLKWNENDFKKKVMLDMLRQKLGNEVIEQVKASHILVAVDQNASEEEINSAQQKANEIYDKLMVGSDFEELAKENSDDPSVSQNGGDLGYFARGVMVPEFEQAAFDLLVGEISKPVRSSYGWHIIKLTDKKGEVQDSLNNWIEAEKEKMSIWIFI